MNAPTIYHLTVDRFRSLRNFSWHPAKGVNVLLGGGDVGKTTVLDAIGLLLSPTNPAALSDTDYYERKVEDEFVIGAIISLPPESGISYQSRPSWPWNWDGKNALVPTADAESVGSEPVYCLRVRGTAELELAYEIVQPNGETDNFSPTLRQTIGLVRLAGEDRNDRDLRLVQGSALDRLISDKALRSRLTVELAKSDVKGQLAEDKKKALVDLDDVFTKRSLPHGLDLGITGSHGQSIAALIGLTAKRGEVHLPLASWGSGTRRFATLAIAEQNQGEAPVTLVDEVERGLEPYRQRLLMESLQAGSSQVFVTTHSPSIISASSKARIWHIDHTGAIGSVGTSEISKFRESDPEMFLSRLSIVVEGSTEAGFVRALLGRILETPFQQHGIYLTDGGGHESTLCLLEALSKGGLRFAGFADNEQKHPERWAALRGKLGDLLFRWETGCVETNVIELIPDEKLQALVSDPEGLKTGSRLRTLADRLGIEGSTKDFPTIQQKAGPKLKAVITAAAIGETLEVENDPAKKKEYKAHGQVWFKSINGGRELFDKAINFGTWPLLKARLMGFCNAVRKAIKLDEILDIQ
jgi:putative ATP-dependent endonuclease of OLD family